MNRCESYRALLPEEAGGGLEKGQSDGLRRHLAACPSCSLELNEYKMVIGCSRDLFPVVPVVPDSVRKRLAAEAAEEAVRRPFLPIWLANPLRPALAGATAAAALLVLGLILGRPGRPVPGPAVESPVRLEMHVQQDGTVRLAWQDGRREVYTVRKSADPRGLAAAETHRVRGNSWVDENPTSSPVVFYQVN